MGWDGKGCHATTRDGRGWLFSRLLGLTSVRCCSTRVLPYSASIQYCIWPYVQCNHAPHVGLDGGGGRMLSVSRCLLVKRQRRRRRGWTDLRDMVYFGDSSRRLTFALSDGGVLGTAICLFTLATRSRIYSTDILLNECMYSAFHIGHPALSGGERRGMHVRVCRIFLILAAQALYEVDEAFRHFSRFGRCFLVSN